MRAEFEGDARLDLTAAGLDAEPLETLQVAAPVAPLKSTPDPYAPLGSTLIHGEAFDVHEAADDNGWVRGRAVADGYIGWIPAATLGPAGEDATHRVALPMTHLYPAPTIKGEPVGMAFLNARVRVVGEEGAFLTLDSGLHVERTHLVPAGEAAADYVAVAAMFVHAPYLWGGSTVQGLDCSGLVQQAMLACGRQVLRDSDMQERTLGAEVDPDGPLARGDLVFWRGHVGMMTGADTILHATEYTLRVIEEPFVPMRARVAGIGLEVTSVRRL